MRHDFDWWNEGSAPQKLERDPHTTDDTTLLREIRRESPYRLVSGVIESVIKHPESVEETEDFQGLESPMQLTGVRRPWPQRMA